MHVISLRTGFHALLVVLFSVSVSSAQSFQQNTYHSPNRPADLFVADLNHDGKPDIVTTQFTSNMITVFLNHGDGTFTDGGSASYVVGGSAPQRVLIADFNHDGNPDIVAGTCNPSGGPRSLSVLFWDRDRALSSAHALSPSGCY